MPAHQPDPDCADRSRRAGVVKPAAVVERFPLPHFPGRANAGGAPEGGVAAEIPCPVETQVDMEHQGVVKMQEKVLAVGLRFGQRVAVEQGRAGREPSLRAAHGQRLTTENVVELASQPAY